MIGILKGALGIIHSINTKNYTARVKLLEYENEITEELTILSPLTYQNKEVHIPKINTPVFCIFTDEGARHGFIIGAFFSDNNQSGAVDGEYKVDFQNSSLIIKDDGNVKINANLTTINSEVEITKNVVIKKNLSVAGKVTVAQQLDVAGKLQMDSSGTLNAKGTINVDGAVTSKENMYAKEFINK